MLPPQCLIWMIAHGLTPTCLVLFTELNVGRNSRSQLGLMRIAIKLWLQPKPKRGSPAQTAVVSRVKFRSPWYLPCHGEKMQHRQGRSAFSSSQVSNSPHQVPSCCLSHEIDYFPSFSIAAGSRRNGFATICSMQQFVQCVDQNSWTQPCRQSSYQS